MSTRNGDPGTTKSNIARNAVLLGAVLVCSARAADPPLPNAASPMDYIAWINAQYSAKVPNESENAAVQYHAAARAYVPNNAAGRAARKPNPLSWTGVERDIIHTWVTANKAALTHLAKAAETDACYFQLRSDTGAMLTLKLDDPAPGTLLRLCHLVAARARLTLLEGKHDAAVVDVLTIFRVYHHIQNQPLLMQYVTALEMAELAYDVLLDLARVAGQDVDYYAIYQTLRIAERSPRRPVHQFEHQKLIGFDLAQRSLRDKDGDGKFETLTGPGGLGRPGRDVRLRPQTLDEIVQDLNTYYSQAMTAFVVDWPEAQDAAKKLAEALRKKEGTLLTHLRPRFARVALGMRRLIAKRSVLHTIFRLHAFHAKQGHWPEKLVDAMPSKSVQEKLVDPFSGGLLQYRRLGEGFLLYSVGENGKDDGGKTSTSDGLPNWQPDGDVIFWPRFDTPLVPTTSQPTTSPTTQPA